MGRRRSPRNATEAETRVQLGQFWLDYRDDRNDWCICWYDHEARTRRRRSTGIGASEGVEPPEAAREALARHYLESSRPAEPQAKGNAVVAELMTIWQRDHVAKKAAPERYAYSVTHLLRFFDAERRGGRVAGGVTVADVNAKFVRRFIDFRKREGVGGATISRDLAALRGALNHAYREELIEAAPFVPDIDARDKAKPRELTYSMEQVASLLEAAYATPERFHVFLYTMLALSTLGRSEAILELDADRQIDRGLIYYLDPDRDQTAKRRTIVPIAPTLAPWLEGIKGRVIRYRAPIAERNWTNPHAPEFIERDCDDIGKAFDGSLIAAGITRPILDGAGQPVILPPRRKIGETDSRPKLRGLGTPNTLRHTAITEMHARGVAEAQIEAAAGHVGEGTNKRNYRHLRPDYLSELMAAIEDYWAEMKRYTTVHLRTQNGPKVISLAGARQGRFLESDGNASI